MKDVINVLMAKNMMFDTLIYLLKKDLPAKNIVELFYSSVRDESLNKELESNFRERVRMVSKMTPFFGSEILIIIDTGNIRQNLLMKIIEDFTDNKYIKLVLKHSSKELYDVVGTSSLETKKLNLYSPPDWLLSVHLKLYLSKEISDYAFDEFKNRMRRQWKYLDDYMHVLNTDECETINSQDVKRIIPKAEPIDFHCIMTTLLLGENYKETMKNLSNYRFARKFLVKEIREIIDKLIRYKTDINLANLSWDTLEKYAKENNVSNWELEKYYNTILSNVSLQWLYKIRYNIILKYNTVLEMVLTSTILYNGGGYKWTTK